jgi:ABC-type sugar transport system substrate-binding protein
MRRISRILVLAAALAASPAAASPGPDERTDPSRGYVPGSEQDPFSQTYDGREAERAREAREREQPKPGPCDGSCACGHHAAEHPKKA